MKKSLSGKWMFALDPSDIGYTERWFQRPEKFKSTVHVPGAWQAQGLGDNKYSHSTGSEWKMPPVQVEKVSYRGTGWYHKSVSVPAEWKNKELWLVMGGTHPVCEIWIDGRFIKKHIGTFLEYRMNVTEFLSPGKKHNLTIRISEYPGEGIRRSRRNPLTGHFVSWGSTWSGIHRDVFLEATESIRLENIVIVPDVSRNSACIKATLRADDKPFSGKLTLRAVITDSGGKTAGVAEKNIQLNSNERIVELNVPISNVKLWSPEKPFLYSASVSIVAPDGKTVDTSSDRFGMREFAVKDGKILLNGNPVWLRGYGGHSVYPMTLCPPTSRALIAKELKRAKQYGFNLACHYATPNREYLDLADELGMLVHLCPVLAAGEFTAPKDHLEPTFVSASILMNINHPSVMIYTFGAEVYHHNSDASHVREIGALVKMAREIDPTRLIVACGGVDRASAARDDTDILEMAGSLSTGDADLDAFRKPVFMHEYRWWSSYPNPALKHKYKNAAMRPFFIEHAEKVAKEKGFSNLLPVFVKNSESLQALERKIGLEQARRSRGVYGYCLYLGQDTSFGVEGLWDDFFDPKNVTAGEFLQTNGETVLLIDKDHYHRNYWDGEKIAVDIWLSHFGNRPFKNAEIVWQLVGENGKALAKGCEKLKEFPSYKTDRICRLDIMPRKVRSSTKAVLSVELNSGGAVMARNRWNFWVFARDLTARSRCRVARIGVATIQYDYDFFQDIPESGDLSGFDLVVTNKLDRALIEFMAAGGRVFLPATGVFPEMFCEFKSAIYNGDPQGNSGTLIREHPALGDFPHDGWCDLQFYGLIEDVPVLNLDAWPVKINPVIRSINNYKKGINRAYLCEARVGRGALLTTTFNFRQMRGIGRRGCEVENTYMFDQLLKYAMSPAFKPETEVPVSFLEKTLGLRSKTADNKNKPEDQAIFGNEGLV